MEEKYVTGNDLILFSRRPMVLSSPRVWRSYTGGMKIEEWQGLPDPRDGEFPEVWVASIVTARNPGREHIVEGLSMVDLGRRSATLKEMGRWRRLISLHARRGTGYSEVSSAGMRYWGDKMMKIKMGFSSIPPSVWAVYAIQMVFAAAANVIGTILPNLVDGFNLTLSQVGVISAVQSLTGPPIIFLAGFMSDHLGPVRVLLIGLTLLIACPLFMAAASSYILLVVSIAVLGIAFGFIDPMTNAVLVKGGGQEKGKYLSLLHAAYGLGAAIFPVLIAFALARGMSWRFSLLALASLVFGVTVVFFRCREQENPGQRMDVAAQGNSLSSDSGDPTTWTSDLLIPTIAMFFYSGVYRNLAVWMVMYFKDILGATQVIGSLALFTLFGAIVIGRLISAKMSDSKDNLLLLTVYMTGAAAALTPIAWIRSQFMGFIAIAGFGLASAGIFPVITSYATGLFPARSGMVTGFIYGSASAGAVALPWLMGIVADNFGLRSGMLMNAISMAIAGFLLVVAFSRRMVRQRRPKSVSIRF